MLERLQLPGITPELQMLSASRGDYQLAFDRVGGGAEAMAWGDETIQGQAVLADGQ